MARFEKAGRFVEVWLEASSESQWSLLRSREGRIGEDPPAVTLETRYSFSARADYERIICERLRDRWRRVDADPTDEPREPAIEAALHAHPDDATTALVYADWLQHRGHPRGALIALQHAGLADEASVMIDAHREALLGSLARDGVELVWERGFVKRARIGRAEGGDDGLEALWHVMTHPSTRFLRELVIGCHQFGDQRNEPFVDLLMLAGDALPLRLLEVADFDWATDDNIDISRAWLGDMSLLSTRYPMLEDVVIKGASDLELGELCLPNARRFALRLSGIKRALLDTVLRAPWPVLRELELWFGDPDNGYGADCDVADAARLFAIDLPELRVLSLRNAMFSDEIVPAALAWQGAGQLEDLDFSLGTLTDAGAATLIANKAKLPSLRRLGVFECSLSSSGLDALRAAGLPVDDRAIAPSFAWREPRQKSQRYATVNE